MWSRRSGAAEVRDAAREREGAEGGGTDGTAERAGKGDSRAPAAWAEVAPPDGGGYRGTLRRALLAGKRGGRRSCSAYPLKTENLPTSGKSPAANPTPPDVHRPKTETIPATISCSPIFPDIPAPNGFFALSFHPVMRAGLPGNFGCQISLPVRARRGLLVPWLTRRTRPPQKRKPPRRPTDGGEILLNGWNCPG